jgi:hypothetical protein
VKLITCAGYYRTGSSAISDFFAEFENCTSLGNFEFRFVQDSDGIADLEYHITENTHRHNTSHAIKRFIKLIRFLNGTWYAPRYKKFFDDKFIKYSKEYVNKITKLKCKAWWHRDQIDRGNIFYFLDRLYAKILGFFQEGRTNTSTLINELSYFTNISKDDFYKYTREYTSKLFDYLNKTNAKILMVDQLVPPSNTSRYLNYFDDIKVISVERDARDLYVLEKKKYKWGIIPYKDVKTFCKWYKITRSHRKFENDDTARIMRIYFEDLIYDYEGTCSKLIAFVGLKKEDHIHKKTVFNPEISVKNTRVYSKYPDLVEDVKYIEEHLSEYLYQFPE